MSDVRVEYDGKQLKVHVPYGVRVLLDFEKEKEEKPIHHQWKDMNEKQLHVGDVVEVVDLPFALLADEQFGPYTGLRGHVMELSKTRIVVEFPGMSGFLHLHDAGYDGTDRNKWLFFADDTPTFKNLRKV